MVDNPYPIHKWRQTFSVFSGNILFLTIILAGLFIWMYINGANTPFFMKNYLFSLLFLFLFFILPLLYNLIYLSKLKYTLTNVEFILKGGIISRFERVLPYSKIQHVIITRRFIQKVMGLSTIVIQTAGSQTVVNHHQSGNKHMFSGPSIPGLNVSDAEKLRDYLIAQVLRSKSGQGI